MALAVNEACSGVSKNHGGPFGAVITCKGKVVAKSHNIVVSSHDPTAHAEIAAIRLASKKLKRFNLSDCVIYSTCEPCPMCMSALMWARIKKVYYGCTKEDAENIGFDDKKFYNAIHVVKKIPSIMMHRKECLEIFKLWKKKNDKVVY